MSESRKNLPANLAWALWAGDVDRLHELAPCGCCCWEHTFEWCEARLWFGCRGQGTMTRAEEKSWFQFYKETRGMSEAEFFCYGEFDHYRDG